MRWRALRWSAGQVWSDATIGQQNCPVAQSGKGRIASGQHEIRIADSTPLVPCPVMDGRWHRFGG
jgi:hypothetical protein